MTTPVMILQKQNSIGYSDLYFALQCKIFIDQIKWYMSNAHKCLVDLFVNKTKKQNDNTFW